MKLITVPGSFIDPKCQLIVPENVFLERFLWFSAELFPYGGKSVVCMSFGKIWAIFFGLVLDNIEIVVTVLTNNCVYISLYFKRLQKGTYHSFTEAKHSVSFSFWTAHSRERMSQNELLKILCLNATAKIQVLLAASWLDTEKHNNSDGLL